MRYVTHLHTSSFFHQHITTMSSTAQTVLAYLEAQTSDAYKLWDAGELAQANDLARGILVNPLATSYHKAQMHILLSLSSDSDSAMSVNRTVISDAC